MFVLWLHDRDDKLYHVKNMKYVKIVFLMVFGLGMVVVVGYLAATILGAKVSNFKMAEATQSPTTLPVKNTEEYLWKKYTTINFSFEYPTSWSTGTCDEIVIQVDKEAIACDTEYIANMFVFQTPSDMKAYLDGFKDYDISGSKNVLAGKNHFIQYEATLKKGLPDTMGAGYFLLSFMKTNEATYLLSNQTKENMNIYNHLLETFEILTN